MIEELEIKEEDNNRVQIGKYNFCNKLGVEIILANKVNEIIKHLNKKEESVTEALKVGEEENISEKVEKYLREDKYVLVSYGFNGDDINTCLIIPRTFEYESTKYHVLDDTDLGDNSCGFYADAFNNIKKILGVYRDMEEYLKSKE